jgi:DNA mismatch repair protein MSH6
VKYVSARAKNEIEVPKSLIKKEGKGNPHKDLIFSSEIAGAIRYVTAESSGLSMELVEAEEVMAQAYEPFLQKLLKDFSKYRGLWDRFIRSSAWVDALMSLAETTRRMGLKCLP